MSVSFFGRVYQSPSNLETSARRSRTSSCSTSYERPRCRYTAPGWIVVKARSASTRPSISPASRSITATESAEAERSGIREATHPPPRAPPRPAGAPQLAGLEKRRRPLPPAVAEELVVGLTQRQLVGGRDQV